MKSAMREKLAPFAADGMIEDVVEARAASLSALGETSVSVSSRGIPFQPSRRTIAFVQECAT